MTIDIMAKAINYKEAEEVSIQTLLERIKELESVVYDLTERVNQLEMDKEYNGTNVHWM